MSTGLPEIVEYSMSTFGVAILLTVNDKVVLVNPQLLKSVPLEDMADVLSNSELTEKEILIAMETLDNARRDPIPTTDQTTKN